MIDNLFDGHQALGLETHIDDQILFSLLDDGAGDDFVAIGFDGSSLCGLFALEGGEGCRKIISGFRAVVAMRTCLGGWRGSLGNRFTLRGLFGSNGGAGALPLSCFRADTA